jgi:hypothetical protein
VADARFDHVRLGRAPGVPQILRRFRR